MKVTSMAVATVLAAGAANAATYKASYYNQRLSRDPISLTLNESTLDVGAITNVMIRGSTFGCGEISLTVMGTSGEVAYGGCQSLPEIPMISLTAGILDETLRTNHFSFSVSDGNLISYSGVFDYEYQAFSISDSVSYFDSYFTGELFKIDNGKFRIQEVQIVPLAASAWQIIIGLLALMAFVPLKRRFI